MKKIQASVLLLMLLALFAAPAAALAAPVVEPAYDDVVIFGRDYVLAAGQTIHGALFVLGGNAIVESGATVTGDIVIFGGNSTVRGQVNGATVIFGGNFTMDGSANTNDDVVVFGGNAEVAGRVGGDLAVLGGTLHLASTAFVAGDLASPSGNVTRDTGATIVGNQVEHFQFDFPRSTPFPIVPNMPDTTRLITRTIGGGVGSVVWLLFRSFALATVALLVVLFMPAHTRRIADTVLAEPVTAGAFGMVGFIVAVIATLGMAITLILIPVAILVPFVLVAAVALGWIALGLEVGHRMAVAFKSDWTPMIEAAVGTFALTFVIGIVHFIPCIGFLFGLLIGAAGLGAVVMTRFGTRDYRSTSAPSAPKALPAPKKKRSPRASRNK